MKPSDDDINDEIPQGIPEEEVERHAKPTADTYRETTTPEVIIQPPLEVIDGVKDYNGQEALEENTTQSPLPDNQTPRDSYRETPSLDDLTMELKDDEVALGNSIQESLPQEEGSPVVFKGQDLQQLPPEVMPASEEVMLEKNEIHADDSSPESASPIESADYESHAMPQDVSISQTPPAGGHHTISGGPETLQDNLAKSGVSTFQVAKMDPRDYMGQSEEASASGFSIPQPKQAPQQIVVQQQGTSIGLIIFILFILITVGTIGGFYILLPDTFNQIVSAMIVIKDQLLAQ